LGKEGEGEITMNEGGACFQVPISPTFYSELLRVQIPKAQKIP